MSGVFDEPADGNAHEVVVSDGGLYPPSDSSFYFTHPIYRELCKWVVVALDGRPILLSKAAAYSALPEQIVAGHNGIGASTAAKSFSGYLSSMDRAEPELILDWIKRASQEPPAGTQPEN